MLQLTPGRILIYYDVPQLFIASDQVGLQYVCLNIDAETEFAEYIAIPVSTERLNALVSGKTDLRSAFKTPETGLWYRVTFNENEDIITSLFGFAEVPENYLPAEGFYFPKRTYDEQLNVNIAVHHKALKVGDVVFINSDNHIRLTISSIDEKGLADCIYYDNKDKILRHELLSIKTLTPTFFAGV